MGVHHAPQPSSHAARLAGRGAFTAAAALALAGGTASLAFASEVPSVPTTQDIQGHATHGTHELENAGQASPLSKPSHVSARDVSGAMRHHASDVKDKASDAASGLKDKAPTSAPALPAPDMKADAGHMADNAKNDLTHAATNWSAAAKGGLTPAKGAAQTTLVANDVQHAVDNGKNDVTHRAGSLPDGAPQLPGVLSFS